MIHFEVRYAPRKTPKKNIEARSEQIGYYWGLPVHVAGVTANEYTVLKIATIVACVRYIATSIAQVDYNVYEHLDGGGKLYRHNHPVDWILDKEANPETPSVLFWETIIAHMLIWGNGYAEIERDYRGDPKNLWQITPDRVTMKRVMGQQVYEIRDDFGEPTVIPAMNMLHIRGMSWDGQVGYNIARLCRDVFGGAIATQDFANAYFENDATPGGVLTTPNTLSEPAYQRMRTSWAQKHQGSKKAHGIAILEEDTKFQAITKNAQESQLIETQLNEVVQIARIFGVPLTKIGHMVHSGNRANMEEDDRAAYKSCLRPNARRIECECDCKLFGRTNKGKLFTLHDFSVLLRGNSEQMTNQTCQLLDRGVLKINEARDLFDYNPIPDSEGGNTRPYPRNFTILEKAGDDNTASGSPASGDAPGAGRSNNPPGTARVDVGIVQNRVMPEQVSLTFNGLLTEAYGRLLRVEMDKAKRAENKGQLGTHVVGYYTEDGLVNVAEAIRPVLAALLLALGQPADKAPQLADRFAKDHATRSIDELGRGTWAHDWTNGRASEQARQHLQTIWGTLS